jgi:hypothetical protein
MAILAQVDANKEICVALAARLRIAPSTVNTTVKSRKTHNVAGSLVKGRA